MKAITTKTKRVMKIRNANGCKLVQFHGLDRYEHIFHFVTTREGGISEGAYATLNPSRYTDDDPAHIQQNLSRLAQAIHLQPTQILLPHQVHQDRILDITPAFLSQSQSSQLAQLEGIDALLTAVPHVCVAISTADCVPVLLYAPDRQVVAAVHAGWRGTVLRIAQRCVEQMQQQYQCDPARLQAAIGPSISQAAFEVGEEVVEAFREAGFELSSLMYRHPDSQKAHIDLWKANQLQLLEAGLQPAHIEIAGICTYQQVDQFFSARRLGIRSGRILSGIYLR